jgi:hypothetical protein
MIVFPADPLRPRRPDDHFAAQAAAARAAGHAVTLRPDGGPFWYRGWMLTPDEYASLGPGARTSPEAYRRAHELPGWYPAFAALTPPSVWLPLRPGEIPAPQTLTALAAPLGDGPAIVKDYVKSRKHEWTEACFVPSPAELPRVATTFLTRQGEFLAGGLVVRAFEELTPGEARVWWLDGVPVVTGPHPDTPDVRPDPPLDAVAPAVAALGCRFVTTDLARRADGVWRVVEVGDGQVSDWPSTMDPEILYRALATVDEDVGGRG